MMYADKGLALFSLMNDMSDSLINESDIGVASVAPKRERASRFSAFMNHPAMVAVLCAVVSLGVVVAIVMAGRGGPVTPPVSSMHATEPPTEGETLIPDDPAADDVHVSYSPGDTTLYCEIMPYRYVFSSAMLGNELPTETQQGFVGEEKQVARLPVAQEAYQLTFHVSNTRHSVEVILYDADMNEILRSPLWASVAAIADDLSAGTYYVTLQSTWENAETHGKDEFVFALSLSMPVEHLRLEMFRKAEEESTAAETESEPETRYEPTESVYACTLVAEQTVYYLDADYIKTTIVAAEPGKTWEGNGMSYRLCRLEGDREIEVYSYVVEPWGESYPTGPDDYATLPLWCNLTEVRRVLSEKGETLTAGKYRMYYLADTYLGIECPYVDVELVDRGTMGQTNDYTLIPHTPTAGINDKYFKISMTATEPGKVLTAFASYRLYRLHGDEEELIHDYSVDLAVYEEPASPDAYAVYETGVSLVWAKSNLEAKGDTLTPGWYRVKFGRASLDFELVDKTGATPEVHPFAELPVPVSVYTSLYTEDMALTEQYERIYKSANKIEKLWAFFTKLTVTEASPPEDIRSGDSLGIHVTYPDGSNGSIHFWGEQYVYFYIDDGPWYQAPPEEVEALMTRIKNILSDPT